MGIDTAGLNTRIDLRDDIGCVLFATAIYQPLTYQLALVAR